MNDFLALDISGSGMRAQRMRMRVITENLANQHVTGPNGPYQRKDTILQSVPVQSFDDQLIQAIEGLEGEVPPITTHDKVEVAEVRPDGAAPILVHDPKHPHADPQTGMVAYPNISIFREMADMMEASRSYEANLAAAGANKDMLQDTLDLLGG